MVQKLEEAGHVVPKGPDGKPGTVINAADQGSVLDRSRLFALVVAKKLYDRSTKNNEFEWPKDKVANTRKIRDIFKEPVEPSHIAPEHVMKGFHDRKWLTHTGVQYVSNDDAGQVSGTIRTQSSARKGRDSALQQWAIPDGLNSKMSTESRGGDD